MRISHRVALLGLAYTLVVSTSAKALEGELILSGSHQATGHSISVRRSVGGSREARLSTRKAISGDG